MSNPQHEPTMEEILASIRKIISEDSTEEEGQQQQPAEEAAEHVAEAEPKAASAPVVEDMSPAEHVAEAEDILELTEELPEEPAAVTEPSPAPVMEEAVDEVVFETVEEEPVLQAMSEPEPMAASDDGIFSDKTRQALDDAFASIEDEEEEPAPFPVAAAAPVPGLGGLGVEAVFDRAVREAFDPVLREWLGDNTPALVECMKPVIREWMDEHFPAMLEEAVRAEVARVARNRRR